ncbi:(ZYRO0D09856g) [Zygosaccharomyces parabailii]|uniref:BN860_06546g1_1 n=1 Tax=Zygosaccharomyces bailii (strain CLIB 213 / ATCC 58445 / CBS 680 / BCRC 21525 / NBRC 1098 / NCYC 1416 / NRRL Y-2227) TaxID=1333698 RepID=A0A8J2T423_ZYGB2|nr:(ZYRO0D09856g) [Zygosaccharomyces parabailii]CDF87446.1 BN860_06546g1_1 [Zygosaccharomyces bailii CLIB 213]CDH15489.1 uncharacterized protein ZBAI_07276 [Zygosaccharomyces bailii ISA1307]SJM85132.1 uncharacterized protein ZBIST_2062 [Zygosaccharomyces bailii]
MSRVSWKQVGAPEHNLLSPAYITSSDRELVFTSGCVGTDSSQNLPECPVEQAKNAFENLSKVLEASGSSLDNVLKVLLFVRDPAIAPSVNRIYQKYFPGKPARSCIVVAFPDARIHVELECVAQTRTRSSKL